MPLTPWNPHHCHRRGPWCHGFGQYHKLVVLIPEVQPRRFWDYLLFNQRGVILDRAIRRGTANVVLCRLRYRLEQLAPHTSGDASAAPSASATAPPPG